MKDTFFLIDANGFLTPSKNYYRFTLAPSYWRQMNELAKRGYIKTIDKIDKEVRPRDKEHLKDDIQLWYENDFKGQIISTKREDIADPWLIATARAYDYTVVFFETMINYSGSSPMGSAKIPNVCHDLNVEFTDLFTMLEQLEIEL